jgi:hypothetical protein
VPDRTFVLDTNLLVLLVVGIASPRYISAHKRLWAYTQGDYLLLTEMLTPASGIIVTPNTLTEAVNLGLQIAEPARGRIAMVIRQLVQETRETYIESKEASRRPEFLRIGLTDTVVLDASAKTHIIITADLALYLEATRQGQKVVNFNHYREAYL